MHTQKPSGEQMNYIYLGNTLIAKDDRAAFAEDITDIGSLTTPFQENGQQSNSNWYYKAWDESWAGAMPPFSASPEYADANVSVLESPVILANDLTINFDYRMMSEFNGILFNEYDGIGIIIPHIFEGSELSSLTMEVFHLGNWHTVWQNTTPSGNQWLSANVDLTHYSGAIKVRFIGEIDGRPIGELPVSHIRFAETPTAPELTPEALVAPTIEVTCDPCIDHGRMSNYESATVNVTVTESCENTCDVYWQYSGHPHFSSGGSGTHSFSNFCSSQGNTDPYSATVWAVVVDNVNGLTAESNPVQLTLGCN